MELSGETLIAADRRAVWAALNDDAVLAACMTGCESIDTLSPHQRKVLMAVKVGPVRAKFSGTIRMEDIRENEGCRMLFEGNGGAAGVASGQSVVTLTDAPGGTLLHYTVKASIGGKLGQVGGRMIDGAAKSMADQFFTALKTRLTPEASIATPPVTDATAMPGQADTRPEVPITPQPAYAVPAESGPGLSDRQRVVWFVLGALASGFGFSLATLLNR